jgi:hypothetical protein
MLNRLFELCFTKGRSLISFVIVIMRCPQRCAQSARDWEKRRKSHVKNSYEVFSPVFGAKTSETFCFIKLIFFLATL